MPDEQPKLLDLEEKPAPTVEGLLRVAQEASAEIEKTELALVEEEKWLNTQRYRLEQMEANITRIVAAAKVDPDDPDSKPLFTNDVARKAEVSRRLAQDPAHKEALAALVVAETEQKIRRIHLDKLNRDYAMAKLNYAAITLGRRGLGEIEL
jgi:hypothetical protein